MTKNIQKRGTRSQAQLGKGTTLYQRVTGNEGPSPLLKQYLRSREKGESGKLIKGNDEKA
jgi:hypothetical protein